MRSSIRNDQRRFALDREMTEGLAGELTLGRQRLTALGWPGLIWAGTMFSLNPSRTGGNSKERKAKQDCQFVELEGLVSECLCAHA